MKLVTAVIRPQSWEGVWEALVTHGVSGLTVSEVSGFGSQQGHTEVYRGAELEVLLVDKIRVEVLVPDADAGAVTDLIVAAARTGQLGDGKVWVLPVESVLRVRTGEEDAAAL
jgi:nitrogen regulatory protein P-II 1